MICTPYGSLFKFRFRLRRVIHTRFEGMTRNEKARLFPFRRQPHTNPLNRKLDFSLFDNTETKRFDDDAILNLKPSNIYYTYLSAELPAITVSVPDLAQTLAPTRVFHISNCSRTVPLPNNRENDR